MKKSERTGVLAASLGPAENGLDPHYAGWFTCFNEGRYYEAHDVLEHLWLRTTGECHAFYKGLIQLAGAFVHLKKQHARPTHPKDGRRLRPASRLLRLALANLQHLPSRHQGLDLPAIRALCMQTLAAIETAGFSRNPWHPAALPRIAPPA